MVNDLEVAEVSLGQICEKPQDAYLACGIQISNSIYPVDFDKTRFYVFCFFFLQWSRISLALGHDSHSLDVGFVHVWDVNEVTLLWLELNFNV